MLQISNAALALLKEALEIERSEDGDVFRLEVQDDRLVINLDQPHDDDVRFEHEGEAVLATTPDVATSLLDETTIDLEATDTGPKLVLVTE